MVAGSSGVWPATARMPSVPNSFFMIDKSPSFIIRAQVRLRKFARNVELEWGVRKRSMRLFENEFGQSQLSASLSQRERMFGFDSAERTDRKPAAGMALQVFNVGSGTRGGFFQRLHWPVAVFAAHYLGTLGEGFVDGAGQPATAYFYLAFCHYGRFSLHSHAG